MEYRVEYEYCLNNRLVKVSCCTVFRDYKKAEELLSSEMSMLERQGYKQVQGRVVERS